MLKVYERTLVVFSSYAIIIINTSALPHFTSLKYFVKIHFMQPWTQRAGNLLIIIAIVHHFWFNIFFNRFPKYGPGGQCYNTL